MSVPSSLQRSAYLLAGAAGVALSALSRTDWCTFKGCQALHGVAAYGVPVGIWGILFFALITLLAIIRRLPGSGMVRSALLGAGLGVEYVLISIQWQLSEWCVVCLTAAGAVFILCALETAGMVKGWTRRIMGRRVFVTAGLLAAIGFTAGLYAAEPVAVAFLPPPDYDKAGVRAELDKLPFIGPAGKWPVVRVYSDFLCPYCGRKESMINEVIREYGDRARFYFCDLPIHGEASQFYITMFLSCLVADNYEAGLLSARDIIFDKAEHEVQSIAEILNALTEAGISVQVDSALIEAAYASNIALAKLDGVHATPTVVVESRGGRREFLRGGFEKENIIEAIAIME